MPPRSRPGWRRSAYATTSSAHELYDRTETCKRTRDKVIELGSPERATVVSVISPHRYMEIALDQRATVRFWPDGRALTRAGERTWVGY